MARPVVKMMQVLPNGQVNILTPDADSNYDAIKGLLNGGWLEAVPLSGAGVPDPVQAYCDEDGKVKGLEPNLMAQMIARKIGWAGFNGDFLVGPVVFLGAEWDDEDGVIEADVPESVIQLSK